MQNQPRVSLLSLHYPPEPTGNAPYTGALASGLARSGFLVTAHVAHPHYPEWETRQGYGQWTRTERINDVTVKRRAHFVPSPPRGIRRLLSELSFGVRIVLARWGSPDVVVAASPALFATALATLRVRLQPGGPRLITWVQDLYSLGLTETGQGGGLVARATQSVEAMTLRGADRVIVIHPRFGDYVTGVLGVDPAKVRIIRNWTHLPKVPPLDAFESKLALGWPTDTVIAIHTGNMGVKQGLGNVVDAARLADESGANVTFILVGDGAERSALERSARGIVRLRFVDPLNDDNYRQALAAADVLIVNEKVGVASMAVPSKLTSYFDAARPIVAATDRTGITAGEVEASQAGIVVPAGDSEALLNTVLRVGHDAALSRQLGENGRRYRDEVLSEDSAISLFVDELEQLLAEHVDPQTSVSSQDGDATTN